VAAGRPLLCRPGPWEGLASVCHQPRPPTLTHGTSASTRPQTQRGTVVLCAVTPVDAAAAPALTPVDAVFTPSIGAGEGRGVPARAITVVAVVAAAPGRALTCLAGGRDGLLACSRAGPLSHISWRGFRPQDSTWSLPAAVASRTYLLPGYRQHGSVRMAGASACGVGGGHTEHVVALEAGAAAGTYVALLSDGALVRLALPAHDGAPSAVRQRRCTQPSATLG
jgi:hypothetical protein